MSLDPKTNILVPEDRDGLYAIDVLDPDMVCCLLILYAFILSIYLKKLEFTYINFHLRHA